MTDPVSHRCHDLFSFPKKKKNRDFSYMQALYIISIGKRVEKKISLHPHFLSPEKKKKFRSQDFIYFFPRCVAALTNSWEKKKGDISYIYIQIRVNMRIFSFFKENLTELSPFFFFPRDLWPLLSYSHIQCRWFVFIRQELLTKKYIFLKF